MRRLSRARFFIVSRNALVVISACPRGKPNNAVHTHKQSERRVLPGSLKPFMKEVRTPDMPVLACLRRQRCGQGMIDRSGTLNKERKLARCKLYQKHYVEVKKYTMECKSQLVLAYLPNNVNSDYVSWPLGQVVGARASTQVLLFH